MRPDWHAERFRAALEAAGVDVHVRPFHDARHAALTNPAASGVSAATLKRIAGHRSINTTMHDVHLDGVFFPDAAQALQEPLLMGRELYPSEPISADLAG